jgi:hypothetical protein
MTKDNFRRLQEGTKNKQVVFFERWCNLEEEGGVRVDRNKNLKRKK